MSELPDAPPPSAEELARLPVFPLPRVVFFPNTLLPLHLFEPRYRAMIEDCMSKGPEVMAVSMLTAGSGFGGQPAFKLVSGVGRIVAHERNANGTHNIVLRGLVRARLEELPTETPYRVARATPLPSHGVARASDVQALLACATSVAAVVRQQHPEFSLGVGAGDAPEVIADAIADRFVSDTDQRQAILEALDVGERLGLVTDSVGELLAMVASRGEPS
ncbi:MAG: LON peptidase substrate-binding domain-containing protein [Myxococcota bacterium]